MNEMRKLMESVKQLDEDQKNWRGMSPHPMDQYANWSMKDDKIIKMRPFYDRVIAAGADKLDIEELLNFAWAAGNFDAGDEL